MTTIGKTQPGPDKPKPKERYPLFRLGEDGVLQRVETSRKTYEDLKRSGDPSRINRYFQVALNPSEKTKSSELEAFTKRLVTTNCFHCDDNKIVSLGIQTNLGIYDTCFQCTCQLNEEKPFGGYDVMNICDLIAQGLYRPFCQLGGHTGGGCLLEARHTKCFSFECTKFPTEKESNRNDD